MKYQINKAEMRREWVLDKWYEKTVFVLACIWALLLIFSFTIGFISGLIGV